jgi:hypothetical protein
MAKQTINPGAAPIVWSTVDEAFRAINDNFTELYLTVSGGPGSVIDLTDLGSNLVPRDTEFYDLGSAAKRWKDLYLSGSSLHLGSAVLTATGSSINLPAGSTIGGTVLDNEYFREIAVAGQNNIVAEPGGTDTLTVASGVGISLTTNDTTDTLTITNSGVTSLTTSGGLSTNTSAVGAVSITNTGVTNLSAGSGISVSQSTGNISIGNTGVLAVTTFGGSGITINNPSPGVFEFVNSLPNVQQDTFRSILVTGQSTVQADSAADNLILVNGTGINITTDAATDTVTFTNTGVTTLAAVGAGIGVSAAAGSVNISNTGVTSLVAGSGIGVSAGTGAVTITNTRFGFTSVSVVGQNAVQADNTTDTLVLIAGTGVELITDPATDSITISANANLQSNVYGEDSTLLVDAVNSEIVGDINTARLRTSETKIALGRNAGLISQGNFSVAIGYLAGEDTQGIRAVAIGQYAGDTSQGADAVAIGTQAGETTQGANSIAIGNLAGFLNQPANSIIINASGVVLDGSDAGFYVEPIREVTGPQVLYYDPAGTKEITWGPVPAGGGGGGGGDFELNVAADDSTLKRIYSGETLKFVGSNGITTTSNAEGQITISAAGVSGDFEFNVAADDSTVYPFNTGNTLQIDGTGGITTTVTADGTFTIDGSGVQGLASRTTISDTTTSIADGADEDLDITGFKGYLLLKIQTDAAAWVRVYTDAASRTADAGRSELTDPDPGAGVVAEVITSGAETILISPGAFGFNNEGTPTTNVPINVKNKSGGNAAITVTLTVIQVEA